MPVNTLKNIPRRALPFLLCLCLLAVGLITTDVWRLTRQAAEQEAGAELPPRVMEDTAILCRTAYNRCGHTVEESPPDKSAFIGADTAALEGLGWQVEWREGQLYLSSVSGDFCPVDAQKRHLRLQGQQLAVYAGPVGGNGELLTMLDLPLQAIPMRWLAQLTNGGIEFKDEETLLMALDNVDELVE